MISRHLSPLTIKNYNRIADKIEKYLPISSNPSILDWGGNDGVLSSILIERGYKNITLYDVGKKKELDIAQFANLKDVKFICSTEPAQLPFEEASFDVVISSGVLEHVPFVNKSLEEIYRILKMKSHFFVFHFPQKTSYTEFIASLNRKFGHTRKYSMRELKLRLIDNGFDIQQSWKYNLLPKTLYGFPNQLLVFYSKFSNQVHFIDRFLSRIPILNLLCNSIECHSIKVPYQQ